ncbi:MAG TPA: type IV toxin-antitoxin system AbiEi family antitoxin domain-containing protein [Conexibacter sp.]|jgi:hypothetical protein|nr:type IV toxin-antitoxin system AbiEi family antitoxin domain-containing protein [Conexibacter sp.]
MVDIRPQSTRVLLAALAERQHGVVSRRQLAAIGVTPSMIKARVAAGHLVNSPAATAAQIAVFLTGA